MRLTSARLRRDAARTAALEQQRAAAQAQISAVTAAARRRSVTARDLSRYRRTAVRRAHTIADEVARRLDEPPPRMWPNQGDLAAVSQLPAQGPGAGLAAAETVRRHRDGFVRQAKALHQAMETVSRPDRPKPPDQDRTQGTRPSA